MDKLPTWAWWTIAGGILLSPVIAFLLAVLVEIVVGCLVQGGLPAILILTMVVISGRLLMRKWWTRPQAHNLLGDQA